MNKPTISRVRESFMHCTLHRLTSGEPECRTGWNYPATRDWPCVGLSWAPQMKKALHDIEGSPAGTGSSHPFLLRRNSSGGWRRDVRPGGGTILFMSAEADVVRSDKSGSKPCRFCVFLNMFSVFNSALSLSNCSPEGHDTFNFTMSYQGPKGVVESDEIVRIASTSTFQTSPSSSSKDEDVLSSCPTKSKWWVFTFLMFYWTRTPGSLLSQKGRATTTKEKVSQNTGP